MNLTTSWTFNFGTAKVTIVASDVISAITVLIGGIFIAKLTERYILSLSVSTKYVWIFNEDIARTFRNMVLLISVFYSLRVLGILSYKIGSTTLSNVFIAFVVFYFSCFLARKSKDHLLMHTPPEKLPEVQIQAKIVYYGIITLAFFLALNIAGLTGRLSTIMAAAGITGVVLGLAARTVIANFVSGLFMYFDKPLKIGDAVRIGDVEGIVSDIRILSTRIRQWDGTLVRIPNENLFNSNIINLQKYPVRRAEIAVGIAYKEDAQRAIEVILKVLDEEPYVLAIPEPRVFIEELADSSVNIKVWAWVPSSLWLGQKFLRSKYLLLQKIKEALDREGIEIPFPQRVNWFPEPIRIKIEDPGKGADGVPSNTFINQGENF